MTLQQQPEPESLPSPEDVLAELGFVADEYSAEDTSAPESPAPESEPPDPSGETDQSVVSGQAAEADKEVPESEKAPEEAPTPDSKLQALMAREEAILARESQLKAADAQIRELESRLNAYEHAQRKFRIDPVSFIRSLAPDEDLDSIARALWYEKLGTAAPPEYRLSKDARTASLEVQELRAELEAERKRRAEEQAQKDAETAENQFVGNLRQYAGAVPDKYQLVKSLATQKPDVAVRMMRDAARMLAPSLGRVPTPEETANAVQEYLADIGYAPAPVSPPVAQTQPASAPPVASTPNTIRNSHSSVQAARVPADESDPRVLRQRALEAMAAAVGDPSLASLHIPDD